MIAVDTSSLVAFLRGEKGADVELIAQLADAGQLSFPPVVVTEILSAADQTLDALLPRIPILEIREGYWERAGTSRRLLKAKGLKAKIADALISQSCIDHDVALITRDGDFRHFAKHCGLRLARGQRVSAPVRCSSSDAISSGFVSKAR
jgi:predicted nucleic acid-binding protein